MRPSRPWRATTLRHDISFAFSAYHEVQTDAATPLYSRRSPMMKVLHFVDSSCPVMNSINLPTTVKIGSFDDGRCGNDREMWHGQ